MATAQDSERRAAAHVCDMHQLVVKIAEMEEVKVDDLPLITKRLTIDPTGDDELDAFLMQAATSLTNSGLIACTEKDGVAVPDGSWEFGEIGDEDFYVISDRVLDNINRVVREGKKHWLASEDHMPQLLKWMLPTDLRFKDGICCVLNSICGWASTRNTLVSMGVPHVISSTPVYSTRACPVRPFNFRVTPAGNTELSEAYDLAKSMLSSKAAALVPDAGSLANLAHLHELVRGNPAAFHTQAEYLVGSPNIVQGVKGMGVVGRIGTWATAFMPEAYIPGWVDGFRSESDYDVAFEEGCNKLASARRDATDRVIRSIPSPERLSVGRYQDICERFGIAANSTVCKALGEEAGSKADSASSE